MNQEILSDNELTRGVDEVRKILNDLWNQGAFTGPLGDERKKIILESIRCLKKRKGSPPKLEIINIPPRRQKQEEHTFCLS